MTEDHQLQEVFNLYITECKYIRQLRPQTIKSYCDVFQTFQKIVPEATKVSEIHPHLLTEFFLRLGTRTRHVGEQTKVGVKASTIRTYFSKLMSFFSWMEKKGYIDAGSMTTRATKPPTPTYDDDRALNKEEVSKLFAAITLHSSDDAFVKSRDLAILSILLHTGIRRGELIGLRLQDIDFESRTLFINGATSKSKKNRTIPMHPVLYNHLRDYLSLRKKRDSLCSALIVSTKQDRAFTQHGLKHWVKRYKLLSGVNFHLHRCRHTFAVTLAKTQVDRFSIMKLLGHSSLKMTETYLRSIREEDARGYIDKMSF